MKTIDVRQISASGIAVAKIPSLLKEAGVEYHKLDCVNWQEQFPYCPHVEFAIAHCGNAILLHYRVTEQAIRATCTDDNQRIWEDSCVEFFVSPQNDDNYYNIECNCEGHLLVGGGPVNTERERSSMEVMKAVQRHAFPAVTTEEGTSWQLSLLIPLSTFFLHQIDTLSGRSMRANFYKCGDLLPVPHFLSWNPVTTEKPNFHRPDCFGLLRFL